MSNKKQSKKPLIKVDDDIKQDALGDGDLRKILNNPLILRYRDLARYQSIDQLLPNDKSYVIILFEQLPNLGHWVSLMKYGNTIEYYDSYAGPIEHPLIYSENNNEVLGQPHGLIKRLLDNSNYKVVYNGMKVQSSDSDIKTCGRHIASRIKFLEDYDMNLSQYNIFLKSIKKALNSSTDDIISYLIDD